MDDVIKKCPACFEIHADYTSVPDDDKIMCVKCGVKFSPSWFIHTKPSPMQLAIHRDNKSYWRNKALLRWGSSGCLVAILIGFVVLSVALLVALSLIGQAIGQAIDGFFEEVRDFFDTPLNPFTWF